MSRRASISAVIPVWNTDPHELACAVASARRIAQEIILVDDHSTDDETLRALREWSGVGVRILASRGRRSPSSAFATGIAAARGTYVLHMDSDDVLYGDLMGELGPINLALNSTDPPLDDPRDYSAHPRPLRWGAIIERGLAMQVIDRAVQTDRGIRQSDLLWGLVLTRCAICDRIPIRYSGLRYWWRGPAAGRRPSITALMPQTEYERYQCYLKKAKAFLRCEMRGGRMTGDEAAALWRWMARRTLRRPIVRWVRRLPHARTDVHVLSYSEPISSLRRTLESLAALPVNIVVLLGGYPGHIGMARWHAFQLGQAEYVTFVDDDDEIIPDAYQHCLDALDADRSLVGVYTDLEHVYTDGNRYVEQKRPWSPLHQLLHASEITHLKLMRRSAVMACLDELRHWPTFEEYVLCGLLTAHGDWLHLPIIGARKRYKPEHQSSMRLSSDDLWTSAVQRVTPILMRRLQEMAHAGRAQLS